MWKTVKLGDVCDFQNGRAFKKSEWSESGLPIIRIQNLKNETTEHNFYDGEYDERIFVANGDLLLSWSGTVKPFIWCHGDALLNQHVFKISVSRQLHQGYAFYLFQNILDEISKKKVGIGLQHITKKTFENFPIPLPPLAEQQRIVAKLDAAFAEIDRAIETTTRSLTESIRLLNSSLELCIAKGGGETESITLGDETFLKIIDGDRGANYPKKSDFSAEGYCVFLNTKNVLPNGFNFDTCQFISDERDALLRKGKLERHDVVLTTRGTLGNVGYYSECVPYENIRINSGMLILRPKTHKLLPSFLFELLRSSSVKLQIEQQQKGAAQQHIPVKTLSNFEVEIPTSVETQSRVVQEIKSVQSEANELKNAYFKKLTQLGALKSAILAQELQQPHSEAA